MAAPDHALAPFTVFVPRATLVHANNASKLCQHHGADAAKVMLDNKSTAVPVSARRAAGPPPPGPPGSSAMTGLYSPAAAFAPILAYVRGFSARAEELVVRYHHDRVRGAQQASVVSYLARCDAATTAALLRAAGTADLVRGHMLAGARAAADGSARARVRRAESVSVDANIKGVLRVLKRLTAEHLPRAPVRPGGCKGGGKGGESGGGGAAGARYTPEAEEALMGNLKLRGQHYSRQLTGARPSSAEGSTRDKSAIRPLLRRWRKVYRAFVRGRLGDIRAGLRAERAARTRTATRTRCWR